MNFRTPIVIAWVALFCGSAFADEWTRFRGPNGSGVARDCEVPAAWTDADYNWKQTLPGVGHSSPVVWKERLFAASADETTGVRWVTCLDAGDGRILWRREFPGRTYDKHAL